MIWSLNLIVLLFIMFTLFSQRSVCVWGGGGGFHQQLKGSESPHTWSFPSSSVTESALLTFLYHTWFSESAITNTKMTINAILTLLLLTGCLRGQVCILFVICLFSFFMSALTEAEYKCHQPCSFTFLVTLQRPIIFHWIVYISL